MTRGISEETLVALIRTDGYGNDYIDPDEALTACTELNPWLPIEDAPKDVPLLVECKGDGEKKIHTHRIMVRAFMDRRSWILY